MRFFSLNIATLGKKIFSGKVAQAIFEAKDGKIEVLCGHAPLATILAPGEIFFRKEDGTAENISCGAGFLIVSDNMVSVRVGSCVGKRDKKKECDVPGNKTN